MCINCHSNEGLSLYKTLLKIEYSQPLEPHNSPGLSNIIWSAILGDNTNYLMTIKKEFHTYMRYL